MPVFFSGLDGEMSGSEIGDGAALIQIGLFTPDGDTFESGIFQNFVEGETNFDHYPHELPTWSEEAAAVHNISQETILTFPKAEEVDAKLEAWILARPEKPEQGNRFLAPVGWNVASFDLPFVRKYLPESYKYIARRNVDLNACVYNMDRVVKFNNDYPSYYGWKKLCKTFGKYRIDLEGGQITEHDALYDAKEAMYAWWFLKVCQKWHMKTIEQALEPMIEMFG